MSFSFRPVQGTDAQIQQIPYTNGYLYFATDSGKIYLDANDQNKFLMGGGGTSVLYANDTTVIERPDGTYIISIDTLEDNSRIKEDDLIINQGDSCFYKVKLINWSANEIICTRIAVSGTGGGPSGPSVESKLTIDEISGIASRMTFVHNQPSNVTLKVTAQDDSVVTVVYEIIGNNNRATYETEVISGEYAYFDIGSKLYEGTNKVNISIVSNNSGSDARSYDNLVAVKLAMTPLNINNSKIIDINERVINISLTGSGLQKEINAFIDNIPFYSNTNAPASVAIPLPGAKLPLNEDGSDPNEGTNRQSHGVHEVKISMSTKIGGKTISVPDLCYEFAWVEPGMTTPIIWFNKVPTTVTNYAVAEVEYQVYDPTVAEGREFQIKVLKDGEELAESPKTIMYHNNSYLTWYISNYNLGNNEYSIDRSGTLRSFTFIVEADATRDMEVQSSNLYLNLDSSGRSNNEASYNRDKWKYKNSNNKEFSAVLNGFNWYNNGWIENEESKISALRISNGATLNIPIGQNILNTSALDTSLTFEFQFKINNVQNYVTMVDTSVGEGDETGDDKDNDGIIDKEVIDTSRIRDDWYDIAFADFYSQGVGFAFGPSDFFMAGGGALAYARYKENELINVSIVINKEESLIYLYINGILTQIKECDTSKNFYNNSSSINFYPTTCDIDLYKVRIYNSRALSYADIVHNVLADLKDIVTYDANQITEVDTFGNQTIKLTKLQTYNINNPDNPSMPYAILKINDPSATQLPYYKGNAVQCDVTFINPALDRAYATGELAKKAAAAGISVTDYYLQHCPSFHKIGAEVDVQGTSSQGYPRRNYKLKCGSGGTWVAHKGPFEKEPQTMTEMYLDNARGEATFTWKADYMESSGSHNTGLTSYVKTLYSKHPLADYYNINTIENYEDLRTTIYGFPMLVFEEKQDGTYEFIGKYNFNLDKDCPTVTGMNYNKPHPIIAGKTMEEVCECWEMCNNKGTRTAFKQMDYDEIVGEVEDAETGEIKTDWTLTVAEDIEYRYLANSKELKKLLKDPGKDNNEKALAYYSNIEALAEWLYYLDTNPSATSSNAFGANEIPSEGITYDGVTYKEDNKAYRLAKFKAEFEQHLDLEYTLIYFIMTELLVLYDSRGKNMMLASWGPQSQGGNYIWYPIFYDVDTQLGIDNSGVPLWDYDVNPSDDRVFSTPGSVLWNNFYATFLTQIKNKYKELRGGGDNAKLSFNKLNGYYDFNPAISGSYAMTGIRPYVVYNADAFYKYIAPARSGYGYVTTEGKTAYTDTYYYCAQGTRELQRELFLNNRFYYLDSKWQAGAFDYSNISASTQIRINSNDGVKTSDTVWRTMDNLPEGYEYPNAHDTLNYFNITPFLNSYAGFYIDSSFITSGQATKSGQTVQINLPTNIAQNIIDGPNDNQGQLVYLSGKKYTSSYGDLSKYYLNEIDLSDANKLTDLLLGSDVEGYRNDYFTKDAKIVFDQTAGYPLLREANFSRLASFNTSIDLTKSEKLENFRALGSAVTEAKFANGVQLKQCYLPKTIDTLKFIEARNLTATLDKFPLYNTTNHSWPQGLYIEGLTNKLDGIKAKSVQSSEVATNIASIYFNQVGMKYDSFLLLEGLIGIKNLIANEWKDNKDLSPRLSINMLNVNWSPYEQVESGAPYNAAYTYYTPTNQYTFTLYDSSTGNWNKDTQNGIVYTKHANEESPITDLSILDTLINAYEASQGNNPMHTFYGTVEGTIGYISGSLYVQNDTAHPISAFEIQNKYARYYPELTIYAEHTTPALAVNYVEENAEGIITTWETQKYSIKDNLTNNISPISTAPIKTHYDFLGWSLTKNATKPDEKQPTDYTVEELKLKANNDLAVTFWAVYTIHKYKVTFYNYDGSSLTDSPISKVLEIPAGSYAYEPDDIIPYRDPPEGKYQVYDFQGYSFNRNNIGPKVDLSTIKVTKDLVLYAYYGNWVNVLDTIHPEYFSAVSYTFTHDENSYGWGDGENYSSITGVQLALIKPVKGKITIPAMFNGYPVVALDDSFATNAGNPTNVTKGFGYNLTHVFFENGSQVKQFLNNAFSNNKKLIEVEIPPSVRRIGDYCFYGCNKLKLTNNTLGGNIAYIGGRAFIGAFDNTSAIDITLGSTIVQMDYYSFANLNAIVNNLYLGSETNPSKLDITKTSTSTNGKIIFSCTTPTSSVQNAYIYTGGRYDQGKFLECVNGSYFTIAHID